MLKKLVQETGKSYPSHILMQVLEETCAE